MFFLFVHPPAQGATANSGYLSVPGAERIARQLLDHLVQKHGAGAASVEAMKSCIDKCKSKESWTVAINSILHELRDSAVRLSYDETLQAVAGNVKRDLSVVNVGAVFEVDGKNICKDENVGSDGMPSVEHIDGVEDSAILGLVEGIADIIGEVSDGNSGDVFDGTIRVGDSDLTAAGKKALLASSVQELLPVAVAHTKLTESALRLVMQQDDCASRIGGADSTTMTHGGMQKTAELLLNNFAAQDRSIWLVKAGTPAAAAALADTTADGDVTVVIPATDWNTMCTVKKDQPCIVAVDSVEFHRSEARVSTRPKLWKLAKLSFTQTHGSKDKQVGLGAKFKCHFVSCVTGGIVKSGPELYKQMTSVFWDHVRGMHTYCSAEHCPHKRLGKCSPASWQLDPEFLRQVQVCQDRLLKDKGLPQLCEKWWQGGMSSVAELFNKYRLGYCSKLYYVGWVAGARQFCGLRDWNAEHVSPAALQAAPAGTTIESIKADRRKWRMDVGRLKGFPVVTATVQTRNSKPKHPHSEQRKTNIRNGVIRHNEAKNSERDKIKGDGGGEYHGMQIGGTTKVLSRRKKTKTKPTDKLDPRMPATVKGLREAFTTFKLDPPKQSLLKADLQSILQEYFVQHPSAEKEAIDVEACEQVQTMTSKKATGDSDGDDDIEWGKPTPGPYRGPLFYGSSRGHLQVSVEIGAAIQGFDEVHMSGAIEAVIQKWGASLFVARGAGWCGWTSAAACLGETVHSLRVKVAAAYQRADIGERLWETMAQFDHNGLAKTKTTMESQHHEGAKETARGLGANVNIIQFQHIRTKDQFITVCRERGKRLQANSDLSRVDYATPLACGSCDWLMEYDMKLSCVVLPSFHRDVE